MFDRFFFDDFFSEHHVRQPTLIRDASRAPRSDVAALRRKGNRQNRHFGAEIPSLTRLAEAELLTIAETTVSSTRVVVVVVAKRASHYEYRITCQSSAYVMQHCPCRWHDLRRAGNLTTS